MAGQGNRRGLQIVRTHTSRKALPSLKKHELYLKLTTLEMERARRVIERDSLLKRLEIINERLANLTSEQAELSSMLEGTGIHAQDSMPSSSSIRICSIQY